MENFAIPSVLKNHIRSYSSANKAAQDDLIKRKENLVNRKNDYDNTADNIASYSKKRESIIRSLESKLKKYNFDYNEPLIRNELDVIIKYSKELQDQLSISLASLEGEKKNSVRDDFLAIPSELTQLEVISNELIKESEKLLKYEQELSNEEIKEKDADDESLITNFSDRINKKKDSNDSSKVINLEDFVKTEEEPVEDKELVKEINEELYTDNINPAIFNEDDEETRELSIYLDSLMNQDDDSVRVTMKNGSSLADRVEVVYGDSELWENVYNYNDINKNKIDAKAEELGMSPEEVVNDKNALNGVVLDFPTEYNVYQNDEENVKRLG